MKKKIEKDYKSDVALKVIKKFRKANMEHGIALKMNKPFDVKKYSIIMRECVIKARTLGFYIWTNENGYTGHSYEKDYKKTPSSYHNFKKYKREVNELLDETITVIELPLEN